MKKVFISALALGCFVWIVDATLDYFFFYSGLSFINLLIIDVPGHEIYIRIIILVILGIAGLLIDHQFSQKRNLETQLIQSSIQRQAILDNMNEGLIFYKNPELEIQWVNHYIEKLFQITEKDITSHFSKKCHEIFQKRDHPCDNCPVVKCFRDKKIVQIEKKVLSDHVWVLTAIPIYMDTARLHFLGVLEIIKDVTAEKKLQSQLFQSQKMEAIGQLAGGVAHDFNNLLTAINGFADLLLEDPQLSEDQRESIQEIHKAGTVAANITNQLLFFSKKHVVQHSNHSVNEIISELDSILKRLIGEQIEITYVLSPEDPQIQIDKNQFQQCIINMVINARDAMPQGGKITIETKLTSIDEYKQDLLQLQIPPGKYVQINVSDTGTGISPDHIPHIFEPFFTTKPREKGTGLGLSTVYGIVHQYLGLITVYSELEKGTTFTLFFPLSNENPLTEMPKSSKENPAFIPNMDHKRIIVVEDDESVLNFIVNVLQSFASEVIAFSDANEVIAYFEHTNPHIDLIISDVIMPKMNGKELQAYLYDHYGPIPFIFISGYTQNVVGNAGIIDKKEKFLQKPFSRQELITIMASILTKS